MPWNPPVEFVTGEEVDNTALNAALAVARAGDSSAMLPSILPSVIPWIEAQTGSARLSAAALKDLPKGYAIGPTAPANASMGDLWLDTTTPTAPVLKAYTISDTWVSLDTVIPDTTIPSVWQGQWSPVTAFSTGYISGSVVMVPYTNGVRVFMALDDIGPFASPSDVTLPEDEDDWLEIGADLTPLVQEAPTPEDPSATVEEWDPTETYPIGSLVRWSDDVFMALTINSGLPIPTDGQEWLEITAGAPATLPPSFNATTLFKAVADGAAAPAVTVPAYEDGDWNLYGWSATKPAEGEEDIWSYTWFNWSSGAGGTGLFASAPTLVYDATKPLTGFVSTVAYTEVEAGSDAPDAPSVTYSGSWVLPTGWVLQRAGDTTMDAYAVPVSAKRLSGGDWTVTVGSVSLVEAAAAADPSFSVQYSADSITWHVAPQVTDDRYVRFQLSDGSWHVVDLGVDTDTDTQITLDEGGWAFFGNVNVSGASALDGPIYPVLSLPIDWSPDDADMWAFRVTLHDAGETSAWRSWLTTPFTAFDLNDMEPIPYGDAALDWGEASMAVSLDPRRPVWMRSDTATNDDTFPEEDIEWTHPHVAINWRQGVAGSAGPTFFLFWHGEDPDTETFDYDYTLSLLGLSLTREA